MNHLAIVRILSAIALGFSALFFVCFAVALATGEREQLMVFAGTAFAVGGLGGTVILLTDKPVRRAHAKDGLAVAVLFWTMGGVISAIPFIDYLGSPDFLAAIYESVSNLATTGHSRLDPIANPMPTSIFVWRAMLHLMGAVATITIAATVFSGLNLGGPGVHRNRFFSEPEGSFFDPILRVVRVSGILVLSSTAILSALLLAIGLAPRDALAGAVGAVTTGMVDPLSYAMAPQAGFLHSLILWAGLVLGTLGLIAVDGAGRGRLLSVPFDAEVLAWIGSLLLVTVLAVFAGLPLFESLGWATSSIATSGIALSDPQQFSRLPIVLVLFPVLIGGSALSAAGGFKLARLIVLSKRAALEFAQLGYRGSVKHFSFRGRRQSDRTIMGVWVYLVGYIVACMIGTVLLSASGLSFDDAIRAGIGSLSNAGHILAGMNAELEGMAQIYVILGMILGRLEVIALLPALNPTFWKN
ncbi:MAG: TrkH family potassium uptake protein [Henriciella sp.]|nr:TrkH family potassium uptake protein [Henriciella sp.]